MVNKNLAYAIGITVLGLAYLFLAAYLGYNYIPAADDGNGNPMPGLSGFLGIIIAVGSIIAVAALNNHLNEREEKKKEAQARRIREANRGY